MKKIKWNTVVFLCYLAYCLFFFILFWGFFSDNDLFHKYYNLTYICLLISFGINTISQLTAMVIDLVTKQTFTIKWLIAGGFLLLFTIAFTSGQSV